MYDAFPNVYGGYAAGSEHMNTQILRSWSPPRADLCLRTMGHMNILYWVAIQIKYARSGASRQADPSCRATTPSVRFQAMIA